MDEQRATRISALLQHPAWPDLVSEIEEGRDGYFKNLSKTLMAGQPGTGVQQAELDYKRGLWAGAMHVVRTVNLADRTWRKNVEGDDQ